MTTGTNGLAAGSSIALRVKSSSVKLVTAAESSGLLQAACAAGATRIVVAAAVADVSPPAVGTRSDMMACGCGTVERVRLCVRCANTVICWCIFCYRRMRCGFRHSMCVMHVYVCVLLSRTMSTDNLEQYCSTVNKSFVNNRLDCDGATTMAKTRIHNGFTLCGYRHCNQNQHKSNGDNKLNT